MKDESVIASSKNDTSATSITPFSLASDDDSEVDGGYSTQNLRSSNSSSMDDGIDVLSPEEPASNFFQWSHQKSGRIVTSPLFKRGVLGLILINSILLAVLTLDKVRENTRLTAFLVGLVTIFLILFSAEVVLKVTHHQLHTFRNGWVMFDLVIVILGWLVSPAVTILRGGRMIRALKHASFIDVLRILVKAILKAFPKLLAIVFLVLLMMTMFAILFTHLFQDLELSENYFGRLDTTMLTLFQIMTLDDWSSINHELMEYYPWAWLLVISYIVTATFLFGSLVIAVVCESVSMACGQRMWKSLENPASQTINYGSNNNNDMSSSKEMKRLAEKLDDLSVTVDQLVRMQHQLSDTLNLLARQQQPPAQKATTMGDHPSVQSI